MSAIISIQPSIMHYNWGKIGQDSLAFKLLGNVLNDLPYAELWYGDHKKAPSKLVADNGQMDLHALLKNDRSLLGERVLDKFGDLPFLAKFLSIRTALSIQCHPNLSQASALHAKDPANYPDKNHKPEIAIAITPVSMLHGWIDQAEILRLKQTFPEIDLALSQPGIDLNNWTVATRKTLLTAIFEFKDLPALYRSIAQRLETAETLSVRESTFLKLIEEYGLNDNGILLSFFLRLLELKPYQSIFTPGQEIHAYLKGDLFECMANSDNVIRAGLTNKFQDLESLLEYGNFECGQSQISQPKAWIEDKNFLACDSQAGEFQVLFKMGLNGRLNCLNNNLSAQLIVILEGNAELKHLNQNKPDEVILKAGQAAFISADTKQFEIRGNNTSFFRIIIPNC